MKRVLFVADNLFPLGPARALISAALAYVSHGIEVHLAARSDPQHYQWLEALPLAIHRLAFDPKEVDEDKTLLTRRNLKRVTELRQLIGHVKPDSIQAGGEIAAAWTQLAALNLVVAGAQRPELVYREYKIPRRPSMIFQWLANGTGTQFSRAIVSHTAIKNALILYQFHGTIQVEPVGLKQLQQIPLFDRIDPVAGRQHLRDHLKLDTSAKIAGTVARLVPRNRIKDLIWATDMYSVLRDDFHFVIMGTGTQYERLKRFADCTEATNRVHFVGEPENAWLMLQGLDVYWHSHLVEPIPLNLVTAMSLGIPVVSVLGEGTSELVLHQQTGFGVNFGARDEFARWTKYLFERTESADQISEQGREFVQNKFSL